METAPPCVRRRSPWFSSESKSLRIVTNETSRSLLKLSTETEPVCWRALNIVFRRACCLSGLSEDPADEDPLSAGLLVIRLSFVKSKLPYVFLLSVLRDRIGLYREIRTIPNTSEPECCL